jgi:carbamate kinase
MRIVLALGSSVCLPKGGPATAAALRAGVDRTAAMLEPLIREHEVVIALGSGPHAESLFMEITEDGVGRSPAADGAESAVDELVGYLLEQALRRAVPALDVAEVLTSCIVDPDDPEFDRPTLRVGPLLDADAAGRLAGDRGVAVAPDDGGYRRIVPSPRPRGVLEAAALVTLLESGITVIASGGAGVPVVLDGFGRPRPAEGLIDPDRAAGAIAESVGADALALLTDVDAVYRDFGTAHATPLRRVTPREAGDLVASGEVGPTGMGPKLDAARRFAETGGFAVIAAVDDVAAAMRRTAGTRIVLP